jgi:hypothetical protein
MEYISNLIINFLISWLAPRIGDKGWHLFKGLLVKIRKYISTWPDDWDDHDPN